MDARRGEKAGWIFGWLGSFLWIAVLAVVFLVQGRTWSGVLGLILFGIAVPCVFAYAPWRHPSKTMARLMIPLYLAFFAGAAWAIRSYGGLKASGLSWWFLPLITPILIPLGTMGGRRWRDGDRSDGGRPRA